jgi:hypothetical protein
VALVTSTQLPRTLATHEARPSSSENTTSILIKNTHISDGVNDTLEPGNAVAVYCPWEYGRCRACQQSSAAHLFIIRSWRALLSRPSVHLREHLALE